MVLRRTRPKVKRRPKKVTKAAEAAYEVRWNGERGRFETWIGDRCIGFHRLREGAQAIGERATRPK